jgi:hypothetical protein
MEHPQPIAKSWRSYLYWGLNYAMSAFFSIKLEHSLPDQKAELSPSAAHSRQKGRASLFDAYYLLYAQIFLDTDTGQGDLCSAKVSGTTN